MKHVKELLKKYIEADNQILEERDTFVTYVELIDELQEAIEQDEKENGWIPVSERLPKTSGTYQVTCMDGRIYRSTYAKFQSKLKRWELTGARSYWKVTAWMPLPEPYKED
ncbi:MAG: DUF551 domain-containing protein [Ruminococcus sp.]|nr:DUF551 domain-containing protein [Ruminococcus sp.]